ncbi:ABC transporter substrate-binding protein, partial [Sellimonas intestinalis]
MMKRKAAALALLMTVSMLAGCGSDGGDKGKKSDGKTTLTFWCHQNEPWVKSYEAMAEKFEKEHPEYTVEVQDYPYDVYNDKIQTAITSDTAGPDIIAV